MTDDSYPQESSNSYPQESSPSPSSSPMWRALTPIQRRVAGVLVEKAKTTPDGYPMSLNALAAGCNQKSNRAPQMNLEPDDVEEALEQLRQMGAVGEVQGQGRVAKYRHYMKEWLGVGGTELAILAELLLRGPQSLGELRARSARMAPGDLPDLNALRPVLEHLIELGLVLPLTPKGRGQIVTHGLYLADELERLRQTYALPESARAVTSRGNQASAQTGERPGTIAPAHSSAVTSGAADAASALLPQSAQDDVDSLRLEVMQLREEVQRLRDDLKDVRACLP